MAGSINRVTLIGNVGKDPEIRTMRDGARVANLSIATSESWRDKSSGEKREKTEWHNVVVWNEGLVGVVEKYVSKGSKLYVEGQLQTRKWQDKDGSDRYTTEVVLKGFSAQIVLLSNKGGERQPGDEPGHDDARQSYGAPAGGSKPSAAPAAGGGFNKTMDEDIPFAPEVR